MIDSNNKIKFPAGLYTPNVFSILFDHEIARAKRYPAPLSLLVFAIVEPAPIISDQLLEVIEIKVAQTLNSKLRRTDLPTRNSDEFLILLPNTDEVGAKIVIQRLLDTLPSAIVNPPGDQIELKFKVGFASHSGGSSISANYLRMQAASSLMDIHNDK
jgi:PleD family two-component response regulator